MLFFFLFQCFAEKEYETESKRNETFVRIIFGTNVIQESWSGHQERSEEATRQEGAPRGARRTPHPCGPLTAPPTYFFLLYIPIYPENIQEHNRSGVPPPQASVATKNKLGPYSGTLPEGGSLTGGHLHHPDAL